MSRSQVALAAYLAMSLAVVPLFMAGPGAGSFLSGAVTPLAGDSGERDPGSGVGNASTTICLVEKYDVTLTNVTMEVRHQAGTPFHAENLTMGAHMPRGDPDDPLIFENDRVEMDKLCSTLSLDHAPIKVIMTDPTIYNLSITGRSVEQQFDRGTSEKLVLYITLESGLKLLPKILTAAHNSSAVSTSSWEATWDTDGGTNDTDATLAPNHRSVADGSLSPGRSPGTDQFSDNGSHGPGGRSGGRPLHAVRRTHSLAP